MPFLLSSLNSSLFSCVFFRSSVCCSFAFYPAAFRDRFYSSQKFHFRFHIHVFHSTYTSTKVSLALKQVSVFWLKTKFWSLIFFIPVVLFWFLVWGLSLVLFSLKRVNKNSVTIALALITLLLGNVFYHTGFFPTTTSVCRESKRGQFSSVTQSCPTLCDPINHSAPGLPVHQQLPEFTQTHVHWVGDAIQPSHPLLSPSPPTLNLSQHQGLFRWVSPSHQVAKILEFQLQHQSFQWTPRTDLP